MSPSFRLRVNPRHGMPGLVLLPESGFRRARTEIDPWIAPWTGPVSAPEALPVVAERAGVATVHAAAVGGPGAAYAVSRLLARELARRGVAPAVKAADLASGLFGGAVRDIVLIAAAEGGHGLAVARAARRFGARCVVAVGATTGEAERAAIAAAGAEILAAPGDALHAASSASAREGWLLASASASTGHTETPRDILQGDRLAAEAALAALPQPPSHVFVPCAGIAASVSVQLRARGGAPPRLVVVARDNAGGADPCLLIWQELDRAAFACLLLGRAGPTAAAPPAPSPAMAGFLGAAADGAARGALGLGAGSRVLVFGREAVAGPALFHRFAADASP